MAKFSLIPHNIKETLRRMVAGLYDLTFEDNFRGVVVSLEIPAGEEKSVSHNLGSIPQSWMIITNEDFTAVVRGTERWTDTHASFLNMATTSTFRGRILIMP